MQEKIYFYYTNDLHSNLEQWPRVAHYMKEEKAKRERNQDSYWLVDIGDHVDRVHPITEALRGKGNVHLLNELGYDFATLGNNEGITFSHEDLFQLYDEATFRVLCANLESLDENKPNWLENTAIVQSQHGVKIGIIGLTAPFNDYYELLGWHVENPYDVLEREIAQLNGNVDVILLLSHLGISEDQEIARRFSEIDVIIGGHTHHLLRTGEEVNQAILTAAGKHCYYVGEVILTWDYEEKKLVKKEAYTKDISEGQDDMETLHLLDDLAKKADDILREPVVSISEPILVDWYRTTPIMQQLTEFILQKTNADMAMFNSGLLLDSLPIGKVTLGDIHRICPHPINACVVELTGAEFLEVARASLTNEFITFELKGFGFRGKILGKMVFAGVNVRTNFHKDGKEYVDEILFHGEPLDPDKDYRVVTADAFTFGRLLPEVAKSENKSYILPEFIRDYLADTLRKDNGEKYIL